MIKSQVMDFVESRGGKVKRAEIVKFINVEIHKVQDYTPSRYRGNYSDAFKLNTWSGKKGYFLTPSKNEPRFIRKESDGLYHLYI